MDPNYRKKIFGKFCGITYVCKNQIIYGLVLINSNIDTSYGIVCNLDGVYCGGKVTSVSC